MEFARSARANDGGNLDSRVFLERVGLPQEKKQELNAEKLQNGLAKLVLTLVQTITDVLERQAVRKVASGMLTDQEVERLGLAFKSIRERTAEVTSSFGLRPEELGIRLIQSPLSRPSLQPPLRQQSSITTSSPSPPPLPSRTQKQEGGGKVGGGAGRRTVLVSTAATTSAAATAAVSSSVTLADVIDRLIEEGTVISGDVTISVAGIDLASLRLLATLTAR